MQINNIIPPRSGTAFILKKGERLTVTDVKGEQVADLVCFNLNDKDEYLSSGRTIDYAETIFLTKGHPFYSNRSSIMFTMVEDTAHCGCFGNIAKALEPYGIGKDAIPVSFNIFMNVAVNGDTGKIDVLPPKSKAGNYITIEAEMDLIVALTACSAEMSNNYSFKEIGWRIEG